jgi:hypothetical protein
VPAAATCARLTGQDSRSESSSREKNENGRYEISAVRVLPLAA